MASVLISCAICGLDVRFPGGQPAPESVVCENPACQAEAERRERVNYKEGFMPIEPMAPAPKGKAKK